MSAMRLDDLLRGIATPASGDILVSGLTQDSHAVDAGEAFVALAGAKHHGIEFASQAAERGAASILAEPPIPDCRFPIPVVRVDNLRTRLGAIAARFYGDPSASMTVIGVTGTSGKTSTVQMLAQALAHLGKHAATIGTLGAGLHGALQAGEPTTRDVIRVHGRVLVVAAPEGTDVTEDAPADAGVGGGPCSGTSSKVSQSRWPIS